MKNPAYTHIISRFRNVSRRYFIINSIESFGYAFAVLIALLCVSVLCESVFYLTPDVKTLFFIFSLLLPVIVFSVLVGVSIIRRPDPDTIAHTIERYYPDLSDRLISSVQLGLLSENELKGQSPELINALHNKVDEETASLDLAKSVPTAGITLSLKTAAGSVAVFLLLSVMLPEFFVSGFFRLMDFKRPYTVPNRMIIYVISHKNRILRGENFTASGFVSERAYEQLNVFYRWDDSGVWNMKPVAVNETTGNFDLTIEKPGLSFQYYLEAGSAVTNQLRVTVIKRPVVESLAITLSYPDYTELGTVARDNNDGNIRALKGTVATLAVRSNKPLKKMSLIWGDSTVTNCTFSGDTGKTSFEVGKSIDYHIGLIDTLGISNSHPITYRVTYLQDEIPAVSILSPASDITLPGSMTFPLLYRAGDDYGLSSVSLRFQLPFEEEPRFIALQKGNLGKHLDDEYVWNLSGMNLLPDDSVTFNVIVYDNDTFGGPKMGISETRTLRLPSMTDIFNDVMDEQNKGIDKLREISDRSKLQETELEEINRMIKSGDEIDWSDKNALEEAKQNMEKMQKDVKDVSESINDIAGKLSEENVVALETLEKLQQISGLMNDIAEGDMKEALKLITQVQIQMSPQDIKQSLDSYKIRAEDIQKKLDRVINLLEQVKSIQQYEMTKNLLEDMAIKQAEMANKYQEEPDNSALPREEENLSKEMGIIQDKVKEVARDLKDKFKINTENLENYVESHDIAETKKQASRQMMDGIVEEAKSSLDTSNTMISELLEQMDAVEAAMQASNIEELKRRLFKSLHEMLVVSAKQELFLSEMRTLDKEECTKQQLDIIDAHSKAEKSLRLVGDLMIELFGVIDKITASTRMIMEHSVNSFASGDINTGTNSAREALKILNNNIHFLTMIIQDSTDAMGMPGDLMQQLQAIANGQLALQQQLSIEQMQQLAAEQQQLAQMLSELGNKIFDDQRLRDMLEKLAGEMDDTSQMMHRNEKREFVERKQLDIYRRLLDARRSRRQKDESETRKSWTAKENISLGAEKLAGDLGEKQQDLNERIKEAMNEDFDPEYLRLIRKYLESLLETRAGVVQ